MARAGGSLLRRVSPGRSTNSREAVEILSLLLILAAATLALHADRVLALDANMNALQGQDQLAALRGAIADRLLQESRGGGGNGDSADALQNHPDCTSKKTQICSTSRTFINDKYYCGLWCQEQKNWDGRSCSSTGNLVVAAGSTPCAYQWPRDEQDTENPVLADCSCKCRFHDNCGHGEDDKLATGGTTCKDRWYTTPAWGSDDGVKRDRCESWCARQGCVAAMLDPPRWNQWHYLCYCVGS